MLLLLYNTRIFYADILYLVLQVTFLDILLLKWHRNKVWVRFFCNLPVRAYIAHIRPNVRRSEIDLMLKKNDLVAFTAEMYKATFDHLYMMKASMEEI